MRTLLPLATWAVLVIPAGAAADAVPTCSAAPVAFEDWKKARARPTGASARDRDHFVVPTATSADDCAGPTDLSLRQAGRFDDGIHAWLYASRCKETACGTAESIERNCKGWLFTGECDLNNNIRLPNDDTVATRLDRYQCLTQHPDLASEGSGLCLEKPGKGWLVHAEITAPHGRARNALHEAWWPRKVGGIDVDDKTPRDKEWRKDWYEHWAGGMLNRTMCVYGPVVADTGHGLKAEVHPAQMIWWNRAERDAGVYAANGPHDLLLIQDASARYGQEHGYVIVEDFPEVRVWRPWSQGPVTGQFEIPIWVAAQGLDPTPCPPEEPSLTPTPAFVVEPWQPWKDGTMMTDKADPKTVCVSSTPPRLYVQTRASSKAPNRFGTRVDWACTCDDLTCGAGYLGYLRIDAAVGLDRDFGEGALGLTVTDNQARRALPERPVVPAPAADEVPKESASVTGQVRRILEDRQGRALERPAHIDYGASDPVSLLLQRAGWSDSSPPLAAERPVVRPESLTLEAHHRLTGVSDREEQKVKVHATWQSVEACELRGGDPAPCTELLSKPKQGTKARDEITTSGFRGGDG